MATATHISLAEYLQSHYEPARELVSGELIPKPMGTDDHMLLETRLELLLRRVTKGGSSRVRHELSVRHGDDVRIPDVVLYAAPGRRENGVLVDTPTLCVEILSPSQRPSELFAKCEVYHAWGVPYCWVLDPLQHTAWEYHRHLPLRLVPEGGKLRAGEIELDMAEVFGQPEPDELP